MKKLRHSKRFFVLLICFIASPSICYSSENTQIDHISTAIQKVVTAENHPYVNQSIFLVYKRTIDDLYFISTQHLLWLNNGDLNNQNIAAIFNLMSQAKNHGLNEDHYNLILLQKKWQQLKVQQDVSLNELATFDVAIMLSTSRSNSIVVVSTFASYSVVHFVTTSTKNTHKRLLTN